MHLKKKFSFLLLLLICQLSNAQNPDILYQKFSKGYDNLDAKAIANLYTKDAEVLYLYKDANPNSFKGRENILTSFEEFFGYMINEKRTLKLVFKIIDRKQVNNKILDNGFYQMTIQIPEHEDFIDYGKVSTVLQKEEGVWKFCTDASTTATKEEFEKAIPIKKE